MIAELNVLDGLFAAGQSLFFVSLIYFFYLVLKFGQLLRHTAHESDEPPLRTPGRDAYAALCRGEPEHGAPEGGMRQASQLIRRVAHGA